MKQSYICDSQVEMQNDTNKTNTTDTHVSCFLFAVVIFSLIIWHENIAIKGLFFCMDLNHLYFFACKVAIALLNQLFSVTHSWNHM